MQSALHLAWLSANTSHSHASLALPLLHAACRIEHPDIEWHDLNFSFPGRTASVLAAIAAIRPQYVCATCYLFNRETILNLCRRIKAILPATTIILGGPEFLGSNRAFLRSEPAVDIVVRGEGESILPELLSELRKGNDGHGLRGICCRQHDGSVWESDLNAEEQPFALLPDPLSSPFFRFDKPFVQLESARGCSGGCSFCCSAESRLRLGSIDQLAERIAEVRRHGIWNVRMLDRTFNEPAKRCVEILDMMRNQFPDMRFHLEIHPGRLSSEVLQALRQAPAGQLHLEAGIQSGDSASLAEMGRADTPARVWQGAEYLARHPNLEVHADLLAGLPHQHLESIFEDVARLAAMGVAEIQLETLKVLPGTVLARQASTLGIVHAAAPPYEVLATDAMAVGDLCTADRLSRLVDRFYNPPALRFAFSHAARRSGARFLKEYLKYVKGQGGFEQPMSLASRLKMLHRYGVDAGDGRLAADVEYAWLRHGYSPQHGLRPAELWKGEVPRAWKCVEGGRTDVETRAWKAEIRGMTYLFLFDRHRTRQPAYAVLMRDSTPRHPPPPSSSRREFHKDEP